jgi:hypothetical protein
MAMEKKNEEIRKGEFLCKIPEINISLIGYYSKVRK